MSDQPTGTGTGTGGTSGRTCHFEFQDGEWVLTASSCLDGERCPAPDSAPAAGAGTGVDVPCQLSDLQAKTPPDYTA